MLLSIASTSRSGTCLSGLIWSPISAMIQITVQPFMFILLCFLCFSIHFVNSVSCYCTACDGGVCEAEWCLVGFKDTRSQIYRTCADSEGASYDGCRTKTSKWQEVCSCRDNDYCNTYLFFRTNINRAYRELDSNWEPGGDIVGNGYYGASNGGGVRDGAYSGNPGDPYATYEDTRFSGPPNGRGKGGPFSNSHLIILLVCVPLGIGALAVVLVFVNYHCKLC